MLFIFYARGGFNFWFCWGNAKLKASKQFFPVILFIWTVSTNFLFSAVKEIQNYEYLRMKDIKQQFLFTIMFKIIAALELQRESNLNINHSNENYVQMNTLITI